MVDTHLHKRDSIRANIRKQRRSLNDNELVVAGSALLDNCKPLLNQANTIAGYHAMQGEIPLDAIFSYCHSMNKITLLPIMRDKALLFAPFSADTVLKEQQFGILEPDVAEQHWLTPQQLDLVLVPLVAFDKTCNRIGMGGGFYDRSFEFRKKSNGPPGLFGVAHALQEVEDVYPQNWDVALDCVLTDVGVTRPG